MPAFAPMLSVASAGIITEQITAGEPKPPVMLAT